MIFEIYPMGMFQANCYIIGDEVTKEGIVVDPGWDAESILDYCRRQDLKLKYILLTHGHGDHIGAVYDLKSATGARILMSQKDEYLTDGATKRLIPILSSIKLFKADEFIGEGSKIQIGNIMIDVIETPGHTPGGLTFRIDNILLTGDTLFQGSVGRTDFEFGSHATLINSIKEKLLTFPDETVVYPGHGPETSIGNEKKYNLYL